MDRKFFINYLLGWLFRKFIKVDYRYAEEEKYREKYWAALRTNWDRGNVPAANPELYEKLNGMLFDKATNVDIACYEDAEFYDSYTKAASQAYERAQSVLTDTAKVFAAA